MTETFVLNMITFMQMAAALTSKSSKQGTMCYFGYNAIAMPLLWFKTSVTTFFP